MNAAQIANTFQYHPPKADQPARYEALRAKARELATLISEACPDSREKSVALTNLQQAVMWANASIAINEHHYVVKDGIATLAPIASEG